MKQIEARGQERINISAEFTIAEKIKIMFRKNIMLSIDLNTSSSDGILESERMLSTSENILEGL